MAINLSTEQQIAALNDGGILVSAGAGSGKTAVLVEHIIYKIERINSLDVNNEASVVEELKRIVVITFTVKASMEMKERLAKRIRNLSEESTNTIWKIVQKNFHKIFIGTIDSLCASILTKHSLSLPFSSKVEIVDNHEWEKKMHLVFEQWINTLESKEDIVFVKKWKKKFSQWIIAAFESTQRRIFWNDHFKKECNKTQYINSNHAAFDQITDFKNFIEVRDEILSAATDVLLKEHEDKAWSKYILAIRNIKNLSVSNIDFAIKFQNTHEEFKGFRGPTAKLNEKLSDLIKSYRVWFDDNGKILLGLSWLKEDEAIKGWETVHRLCSSSFSFCEKHYGQFEGFCFSDLSYYALILLRDNKLLNERGSYLVVDELQDTSEIQLEIIQRLSKFKKENLYGVGDIKQAIYGFRGGKSHVFYEFSKLVQGNEVVLKDNYRSLSPIVYFNNKIFDRLLKTSGSSEQNPITFSSTNDNAAVETISWDLSQEGKLEEWQTEMLEFIAVIDKIKKILNNNTNETIAVLFRTNDQIRKFSSLLFHENIPCSVQWKMKIEDDPLYIIFKLLVYIGNSKESGLLTSDLEKSLDYFIKKFEFLEVYSVDSFFENLKIYDIFSAFVIFLNDLNVSIDVGSAFIKMLKKRVQYEENNFATLIKWVNEISTETTMLYWNIPFETRSNRRIILQTIHASKGLQYDHVLLPRISKEKNKSQLLTTIMGEDSPFVFKQLTCLKGAMKTPQWFLEEDIRKKTEKSEGMRLFYVACTRAKKTLTMSLAQNAGEDSWASLVSSAEEFVNLKTILPVDEKAKRIISQNHKLMPIFESAMQKLWHRQFCRKSKSNQKLKIIPSLSVTALTIYERCPRKYYYSSIVDLAESKDFKSNTKTKGVSSAERGIKIHEIFHQYYAKNIKASELKQIINNDSYLFFEQIDKEIQQILSASEVIALESEIRFSWKKNIIVGTPDMYAIKDQDLYLWDFKTGLLDEEDKSTYLLQLYWYVLAISEKHPEIQYAQVNILAIDNCELIQNKLSVSEVFKKIENWWDGYGKYYTKKISHCSKCSCQVYCH